MKTVQDVYMITMLCLFLVAPCRARLWKMTFGLGAAPENRYGCDVEHAVGWRIVGTFPDNSGDMYLPPKRHYDGTEVYEEDNKLKSNLTGVTLFVSNDDRAENCKLPLIWVEIMDVYNPEYTLFCKYKPGLVLAAFSDIKGVICAVDKFPDFHKPHGRAYDDRSSDWKVRHEYIIHHNGKYYHDD